MYSDSCLCHRLGTAVILTISVQFTNSTSVQASFSRFSVTEWIAYLNPHPSEKYSLYVTPSSPLASTCSQHHYCRSDTVLYRHPEMMLCIEKMEVSPSWATTLHTTLLLFNSFSLDIRRSAIQGLRETAGPQLTQLSAYL